MYEYNESANYNPNGAMPPQMMPNLMSGDTQNINAVQIQEGGNTAEPQTIPIYAIDSSVVQFDIPDPMMRRAFVRKVFTILLLQNIIILPVIEIFVLCTDKPIEIVVYGSLSVLAISLFAAMYFFSEYRRYPPVNMLMLILVTVLLAAQDGVYATQIDSKICFLAQLIIIAQILTLIIYTKQNRFRFTNINAILLIVFVFVICVCIVTIISPMSLYAVTFGSALNVIYFVYDIQLMLSGHHAYNLKPEEHIFAAVNVYADVPNLVWRFLRYLILNPIVKMWQFFVSCCSAEVC